MNAHAAQRKLLFHHIARGARNGCDDGPFKACKKVQQSRFSHIGASHNGCLHAAAQHGARIIAAHQFVQHGLLCAQRMAQGAGRKLLHVLLRVIGKCSNVPGQRHQRGAHGLYFPVQRTLHGGGRSSRALP